MSWILHYSFSLWKCDCCICLCVILIGNLRTILHANGTIPILDQWFSHKLRPICSPFCVATLLGQSSAIKEICLYVLDHQIIVLHYKIIHFIPFFKIKFGPVAKLHKSWRIVWSVISQMELVKTSLKMPRSSQPESTASVPSKSSTCHHIGRWCTNPRG